MLLCLPWPHSTSFVQSLRIHSDCSSWNTICLLNNLRGSALGKVPPVAALSCTGTASSTHAVALVSGPVVFPLTGDVTGVDVTGAGGTLIFECEQQK